MIQRNMHLGLVYRRLHQAPLKRFIFGLLLFATACAASSADSRFEVVAKKQLFIDRSLLIEHLFKKLRLHPWIADHRIIIGARKSGKSTNLSMMKQFFALSVDESGGVLAPNTTKHYALFKSLKIGQTPIFEHAFARVPVIYVNLADFVVNGSEKDFKKSFCKVIRTLLTEHKYLLQNIGEDDFTKKELESYRDAEMCQKKRSFDMSHFGNDLAWQMHRHFGTRALVLIDEIDAPAMSLFNSKATSVNVDFIDHVCRFVRSTIEDNTQDIMGSFLTGTTLQGFIPGHMCVFHYYAFNEDLKYFYGVTENEVRRLLSISGIPVTTSLMQQLRDTYGGYGATDEGSKDFVFNTQSILKFCQGKVIKPYWDVATGITPFKKLLSPERDGCLVEEAMHSEVKIESVYDGSVEGLREAKDFLTGKNETLRYFWWSMEGYLWEIGLFTNHPSKKSTYRSWQVKVPNDENRIILLDTVLNEDYYMAKHGVNKKLVHDFVISVAKLDAGESSFDLLTESVLNLFPKGTQDMNDEAVFRYPLYSYMRQADKGLFSKVTAELGRKTQRKSDIVVTLKDGSKVFMGLTLDKESGLGALMQVLEDKQLQEFVKMKNGTFFSLGINFRPSASCCDVSYLVGSMSINDARNVTRPHQSTWAGLYERSKRLFWRSTVKP